MPSKPIHRLGDLQLRIMKVLWSEGVSSVAEVHGHLGNDQFAYTTVATMLRKMEARGLVRHRTDGRRFIYESQVTADEVKRTMTDDLVDRLFEGSLSAAVNHLLTSREVSPSELADLEQMIKDQGERR